MSSTLAAVGTSRGHSRSADAKSRAGRAPRSATWSLALAAYVPVLRSDPGKVAADTKQYLYLDPGRLLSRAVSMWDPHIGMGTVTHQNIGYLFPMGPYYWILDTARRSRLGRAAAVARLDPVLRRASACCTCCARSASAGRAWSSPRVAYMFTPYTLDYSARISVILLPFAALPWMIALTRKALRDGGWRYPALFALVVQVIGGVNATALIFAGVGAGAVDRRTRGWSSARSTGGARSASTLRIGVLTLVTSLWWIAGLEMQGTYGLDILKYTETVKRGRDRVVPQRDPARPRLLVLLRRRPRRPVDRGGEPVHAAAASC